MRERKDVEELDLRVIRAKIAKLTPKTDWDDENKVHDAYARRALELSTY